MALPIISYYFLYFLLIKYAGFQPFFPPELSLTTAKNLKRDPQQSGISRFLSSKGILANVENLISKLSLELIMWANANYTLIFFLQQENT